MPSLQDFIAEHGITSSWKRVTGPRPSEDWPEGTNHYSVTLRHHDNKMTVPFHKGSGLSEPPSTEEVLDTLAMDSSGYENAQDVDDWMSEYGETDYMRGRRIYKDVEKQAQKLVQFLGEGRYKVLLWEMERE